MIARRIGQAIGLMMFVALALVMMAGFITGLRQIINWLA